MDYAGQPVVAATDQLAWLRQEFHLSPEQFAAIPINYMNGRERRYDEAPPYPEAI